MALDPAASPQEITGPKFTIITKALQPMSAPPEGSDGRRRFRATASSTIEDYAGDEIEVGALQEMAEKFSKGVTIFMDHKFREVDKAFGLTDNAQVIQRGFDEKTGKAIWDLDIEGVVNVPNPRAVQLADSIDGGYVKLGASVTAFVRKHAKKASGAMLIKSLDLVEASIVGVPENQRSWAQKATLAIKGFGHTIADQDEEEEPLVDENPQVDATGAEVPDDAGAEPAGAVDETVSKELSTGDAPADNGDHAADEAADGTPKDGQESAPVETPETASDDAAADETDPPVVEKAYSVADVRELVGQVTNLVREIGRLNELIVQKDAKITSFETDAGLLATEVDQAKQVITKVLGMPLRSQTAGYVEEFAATHSLFAPEVAEYLNKRSKINGN